MLRRTFLFAAGSAGLVACGHRRRAPADALLPPVVIDAAAVAEARAVPALAALEGKGRLGVAILATDGGRLAGQRVDERFAMCSTFKLALAALLLERAANGGPSLDTPLTVTAADLQEHAPVTAPLLAAARKQGVDHVEVTIGLLARAAQTTSDNTAANVLLRHLGGPAAVTDFCRAHGDTITRLDRIEPEMNRVHAGDPRDTTTPRAYATLVARLLGADGLPAAARAQLRAWMIDTTTGAARLRAGLPAGWLAGDKTGTGLGDDTARLDDVAWIEPPGRPPIVVAVYYEVGHPTDDVHDEDQKVLADVGRIVAAGTW